MARDYNLDFLIQMFFVKKEGSDNVGPWVTYHLNDNFMMKIDGTVVHNLDVYNGGEDDDNEEGDDGDWGFFDVDGCEITDGEHGDKVENVEIFQRFEG